MQPLTINTLIQPSRRTVAFQFYVEMVLIGLVTYAVHEAAHWFAGSLMGAEMMPSLNGVRYLTALSPGQRAFADIAGPAVTMAQALIAYVVIKRHASMRAFAFLYMAAFMRIVAGLISLKFPNDEARVSLYLNLPAWVLPVAVAGGLVALVAVASRRLGLGWKTQLLCYVVASVTTTVIVGGDMLYTRR
ncbi:MAG: hypothetical protein ABWY27_14260 [Telluria sp.]